MTKTIRSPGHEALREALIAARKAAGMTQADLARKLKCHQSFVARLDGGERRIDVVEMVVVCRALDAEPVSFVTLVDEKTAKVHRV